jgi:hypothetical protein
VLFSANAVFLKASASAPDGPYHAHTSRSRRPLYFRLLSAPLLRQNGNSLKNVISIYPCQLYLFCHFLRRLFALSAQIV